MLRSDDESLPLSAAEIKNLTNQLNNLDYEVITKMDKTIMAIRVDRAIPDLMEDIEKVYHQLDERDTEDLTHVLLLGNEEVTLVKPEIIKALMTKRSEDENVLIFELREKLNREFGTITFKDERDPYGIIRFAVRAPSERVVREPSQMHKALSKSGSQIDADVFYIIGDSNFIRLNRRAASNLISVPEKQKIEEPVIQPEVSPADDRKPESLPPQEPVKVEEEPVRPSIYPPLSFSTVPEPKKQKTWPSPKAGMTRLTCRKSWQRL